MKKKTLSQTNPYLKDRAKRRISLVASVCSSSAIEGIAAKKIVVNYLNRKADQPTSHAPARSVR